MSERPKFSLRALFGLTAAVAVSAELCAAPLHWAVDWWTGVFAFMVMTAVPTSAMVGVMYSNNYGRVFSLGVLVPSLWASVHILVLLAKGSLGLQPFFTAMGRCCDMIGAITLCSLGVGLISAATYWFVSDSRPQERM